MRARRLLAALLLLLPVRTAQSQVTRDTLPSALEGFRTRVLCTGQRISDVVVVTQPPYTERLPRDFEFLRRGARRLHSNTRESVVRRYLLFGVGDACTELRRTESERILRAQPFLVDARIVAYDDREGGVRLEVETRDEFSLLVSSDVRFDSPYLRALRIGDGNVMGTATDASIAWRDGGSFRDGYGARIIDYQFSGRPTELRLDIMRTRHGNRYLAEWSRPYYTDLQQLAWDASVGGITEYFEFLRPGLDRNALLIDRRYVTIGGIGRVGPQNRLKLVGLSFSREHQRTDDEAVVVTDTAIITDTLGPVPGMFRRQDVGRLNLLLGLRRLRFERVVGFDALTGAQDVPIGLQVGVQVGRALPLFGSQEADRFLATDIYAGYGGQRSYVAMQMLAEGRTEVQRSAWKNVVSGGRVAWYLRPSVHQLTLTQLEWSSGSQVQVPFQLSLRDLDGGIIGYRRSRLPGSHRVVVRTEQRMVFPAVRRAVDAGAALFADAGRLWRGDAPYGVDSRWLGTVGVSIQAAVPPRSRRLWRLDFGFPIGGDPDARFEVRISKSDRIRSFWRPPDDLVRARERTAPTSIFSWP